LFEKGKEMLKLNANILLANIIDNKKNQETTITVDTIAKIFTYLQNNLPGYVCFDGSFGDIPRVAKEIGCTVDGNTIDFAGVRINRKNENMYLYPQNICERLEMLSDRFFAQSLNMEPAYDVAMKKVYF
jgi:hypothetical protein